MAEGAERFRGLWEDEMFARQGWDVSVFEIANLTVPVKRHRGEPGHTRDTRAHGSHRRTSQPSKPTNPPSNPRPSGRGPEANQA